MYCHFTLRSHILVVAAIILIGYSSSRGQPPLEWPDKVYHLITIDNVVDVTGDSLLLGEKYLALDALYSPIYFPGNISGNIQDLLTAAPDQPNRQVVVPTTDTITLRIICKPEDRISRPVGGRQEMSMSELMDYLQIKIQELYIGKFINWRLSTDHDTLLLNPVDRMDTDFETLAFKFDVVSTEVTVIMHEHYASSIAADTQTNIIRIAPDAFYNESTLHHELGHLWGLCHPKTCCNLCECYQNHFMYVNGISGVGQIMIRDWMVIINECACKDTLCNSCTREECVDDREVTPLLATIDHIEFEVASVNLDRITEEELVRTYQLIGERDSQREKDHKKTHRYFMTKYKPKIKLNARGYADFQTRGRRQLRLVRYISVLERLLAQDSTNVQYQKLMERAKKSLQTGTHVKHSPDTH